MTMNKSLPWYRSPYVWMIIIIPLLSVVMGIIMFRLAIISDDGMVVDDYYRHGKEINKVISRDLAAARLKLNGTVSIDYKSLTITATLAHKPEYSLPDQIELKLLYSTRAGYDVTTRLNRAPDGSYFAVLPSLHKGRWDVMLEADNWRLLSSINIPDESTVRINHITSD
jgi:hypothetical protein